MDEGMLVSFWLCVVVMWFGLKLTVLLRRRRKVRIPIRRRTLLRPRDLCRLLCRVRRVLLVRRARRAGIRRSVRRRRMMMMRRRRSVGRFRTRGIECWRSLNHFEKSVQSMVNGVMGWARYLAFYFSRLLSARNGILLVYNPSPGPVHSHQMHP